MRHTTPWTLFLALLTPALSAQPRVTVTLYDYAKLNAKFREEVKAETSRIFHEAGVELEWIDCHVAGKLESLAKCSGPMEQPSLMLQFFPGKNTRAP